MEIKPKILWTLSNSPKPRSQMTYLIYFLPKFLVPKLHQWMPKRIYSFSKAFVCLLHTFTNCSMSWNVTTVLQRIKNITINILTGCIEVLNASVKPSLIFIIDTRRRGFHLSAVTFGRLLKLIFLKLINIFWH